MIKPTIHQPGFVLGIIFHLFLWSTNAQTPSPSLAPSTDATVADCSAQSGSCLECVSANCAWAIGGCQDSCDGFPLDCYSLSSTDIPNTSFPTAQSVCELQQLEAQDAAFCGVQTTCEACTSMELRAPSSSSVGVERQPTHGKHSQKT